MRGVSIRLRITLAFIPVVVLLLGGCAGVEGPAVPPVEAAMASEEPPAATHTAAPSVTPSAAPTATAVPTTTATPTPTPEPTATPLPPDWQALGRGISQAHLPVPIPGRDDGAIFWVYALRLDPDRVEFRVFHDTEARSIDAWHAITGADVTVNGGFFFSNYAPQGRLVIDGEMIGTALDPSARIGVPGLFGVLDGKVTITSLGRSEYTPRGMRFDQAVEAYPMLLLPGRQPAYPPRDGDRARRTVIGLDEEGHVILLLVDGPIFSLVELADWLAESNLNLQTALNLDGGRSSALAVTAGGTQTIIPAYVDLPIVIAAYAR